MGARLAFEDQDRAAYVMESAALRSLLQSSESSILLMNGNSATHSHTSALSHICAMIAHFMSRLDFHVAHYFCGLHATDRPPRAGPIGLLASLNSQLARNKSDPIFGINPAQLREIDDTRVLIDILKALVCAEPRGVTFIVIDGISFLDRAAWSTDLEVIISTLRELVSTSECVLKVILTSPKEAMGIRHLLGSEEILYVPKEMVNGRRMGFGITQFESHMNHARERHYEKSIGKDSRDDDSDTSSDLEWE